MSSCNRSSSSRSNSSSNSSSKYALIDLIKFTTILVIFTIAYH
jgi:hypothetical protein